MSSEYFKQAVETKYPLDWSAGEMTFDKIVRNIYQNCKQETDPMKKVYDLLEKLKFALDFTMEEYGTLRRFSLWYIPAFITDNPWGDSELVIAVKAENNGTTLVFSDSRIVPSSNVCGVYDFC